MGKKNELQWNFWPKNDPKWSFNNPYSSVDGSLTYAIRWAIMLKERNHFNTVCFKNKNGKKVYEI